MFPQKITYKTRIYTSVARNLCKYSQCLAQGPLCAVQQSIVRYSNVSSENYIQNQNIHICCSKFMQIQPMSGTRPIMCSTKALWDIAMFPQKITYKTRIYTSVAQNLFKYSQCLAQGPLCAVRQSIVRYSNVSSENYIQNQNIHICCSKFIQIQPIYTSVRNLAQGPLCAVRLSIVRYSNVSSENYIQNQNIHICCSKFIQIQPMSGTRPIMWSTAEHCEI